ncbi:hypothetical protein C8F04DRAFT_1198246 [Mycena alexandri]|uniref:Uncharacterized protein n=1 Tax=Mycena alexandri TaxID=1745969 RepID=A0AAD6S2Y2_9AGAR|nr:hypothetical protein C8F04DRAFT_1198246 [Mycena alexandri]
MLGEVVTAVPRETVHDAHHDGARSASTSTDSQSEFATCHFYWTVYKSANRSRKHRPPLVQHLGSLPVAPAFLAPRLNRNFREGEYRDRGQPRETRGRTGPCWRWCSGVSTELPRTCMVQGGSPEDAHGSGGGRETVLMDNGQGGSLVLPSNQEVMGNAGPNTGLREGAQVVNVPDQAWLGALGVGWTGYSQCPSTASLGCCWMSGGQGIGHGLSKGAKVAVYFFGSGSRWHKRLWELSGMFYEVSGMVARRRGGPLREGEC